MGLLARAVRQFQTYPATSPCCTDAVAACHRALVERTDGRRIVLRVRPHELVIDDEAIGASAIADHGLARRLHRAHVAALSVDGAASPRDLSRFCRELANDVWTAHDDATFAETLAERGVDRIVAIMALRPEVLGVGLPDGRRAELLTLEQQHRATVPATGAVTHMYPPDRGFVRLDPTVGYESVTLADLAILIDDPYDLASMLLRLTGEAADPATAFARKYSDVATLFGSLSPNLARLMLSRLARAVLALDDERRAELLRRTILPGLLDGRVDGTVLRDFPDPDLAESLCLLLDLETAAPEVLASALDRLELAPARLESVAAQLDRRVQDRAPGPGSSPSSAREAIARAAEKLLRVNAAAEKSFASFAAFDLSMDAEAVAGATGVREAIGATDPVDARLTCLASLVAIERSPSLAEPVLRQALQRLRELERRGSWTQLTAWLEAFGQLAGRLQPARPEIAESIAATVRALYTPEFVNRLRELYERDEDGRRAAREMLAAAGADIGPAFVKVLDGSPPRTDVRSLTEMMSERAGTLAPVLAGALGTCRPATVPMLVRILGCAGAGWEQTLAAQLTHRDELTVREALRALVRIGSPQAAALVAAHVCQGPSMTRSVAEAALWRFPRECVFREVAQLLQRREFVRRHPSAATRLVDRAAAMNIEAVRPVLRRLVPLRFCVWSRGLMRVGTTARRCLAN